ncbi:hypothetical protein [Corynebacterium aquatimens]|uniref:Uncharacterized protein n=1 Tax=Corynebacterium aquatimens TaxID=1190508 RepID=A0A931E4H7_9CORY|nr:hypothetical protein [Corynebacterium aquatimens]MBG6122313.1 hypothetical protein [Corynebacterium aquatimens]
MKTNTSGNQDMALGAIVIFSGLAAMALYGNAFSYVTAGVCFIAGAFMIGRGIIKNRNQK